MSTNNKLPKGVRFEYTEHSEIVKEAFERVAKGESLLSVADDLGFASPAALRETLRQIIRIGNKWIIPVETFEAVQKIFADNQKTYAQAVMARKVTPN